VRQAHKVSRVILETLALRVRLGPLGLRVYREKLGPPVPPVLRVTQETPAQQVLQDHKALKATRGTMV
jgi:hypothetical protein